MSTKIYNGYVIKNTTVAELLKILFELREDFSKIVRENSKMATLVVDIFDDIPVSLLDKSTTSLDEIMNHLDECDRKGTYNYLSLDYTSSIVLYPHANGNIYCCVFGFTGRDNTSKKMMEAFLSKTKAEYFGYWNNTDQDENCTEQEWEHRKEIWDSFMGKWYTFAEAGLSFEFIKTSAVLYKAYREYASARTGKEY